MEDWKRIIKSDYGKIYKGHSLNIYTTEEKILMSNTYYGVTIEQEYNKKEDKTSLRIHEYDSSPKWVQNLVCSLTPNINMNNIVPSLIEFRNIYNDGKSNWKIKIELHDCGRSMELTKLTNLESLNFNDPVEQINDVKKLSRLKSLFYKKIKDNRKNIKKYLTTQDEYSFELKPEFFSDLSIKYFLDQLKLPF